MIQIITIPEMQALGICRVVLHKSLSWLCGPVSVKVCQWITKCLEVYHRREAVYRVLCSDYLSGTTDWHFSHDNKYFTFNHGRSARRKGAVPILAPSQKQQGRYWCSGFYIVGVWDLPAPLLNEKISCQGNLLVCRRKQGSKHPWSFH